MTTKTDHAKEQATLKELLDRYEEYHKKWTAKYDTSDGFDEWFTSQVTTT